MHRRFILEVQDFRIKVIESKLHLDRSTTLADRLQNVMLLNSNKDILDNDNMTMLVDKWSLLKDGRMIM